MRTYHEVLTNAKRDRVQGNHRVEFTEGCKFAPTVWADDGYSRLSIPDTITRVFIYHSTIVCAVDDINKKFYLTHGGWFSRSTNEALAGYRQVFQYDKGYENVTKIPVWGYER